MADVINATPTYDSTPVLSKVKIGGETYYLKDADARSIIDIIYGDYLKSADKTELLGKIEAEEDRAEGVEGTLQSAITALEGKVGTADDAASATGTLYARIKKEIADRQAAIEQEVTDRNAAITSAIEALDVTDTAETGKYVSAVSEIDGKIQVTRAALPVAAEYSLAKEGTTPEGLAARYYLTKDNVKVGEYIDIAKDQFLKDATFIASATEADKAIDPTVVVGDPYIKFTFQTTGADKITYVAVKGLVDVYTAGNGIDITDNVITAVAKENDPYIEVTANGIASKGIDTAIATAVAAETERATGEEAELNTAISNEVTRATGKETELETAISDEETRAKAAEEANADAIDALDTRVTTAEGDIESLEGRMDTAEADIDANTAAIATEKTRAEGQESAIRSEFAAADTTLDGKITAEATARAEADTAINTKIGAKTDATAETVYGAINKLDSEKVNKTQKVAGIDLQDDITVAEMQNALGLEDLAYSNTASGTVASQTITDVKATGNISGIAEISMGYTATDATLTKGEYTPAGSIDVTLSGATFNQITDVGSMPVYVKENVTGGKATVIDTTKFNGGSAATFTEGAFTPASLTYAASDEFVKEGLKARVGTSGDDLECLIFEDVTNKGTASVISAFSGGSKAADTFNGGSAASLSTGFYTAGSDVVYTASQWTEGVAPTMAENTVAVATKSFTGTKVTDYVTGVTYDKANKPTGNVTVTGASLDVGDIVVPAQTVTVTPDA